MWLIYFILFLHKQEWLECLSKIRCNKNKKNIYVCIYQCQQALSSKLRLTGGIKPQSLILCYRYQKSLNKLLKVCYVPATSAVSQPSFLLFLLQTLTVLMKQTRQPVLAIKQPIDLDVYVLCPGFVMLAEVCLYNDTKFTSIIFVRLW